MKNSKTIVAVARKLENHRFVLIGPEGFLKSFNPIPINIGYYENVNNDFFLKMQSKFSITLMPINTEASVGSLVIFTAVMLSIPVIVTYTYTTIDYIDDNISGLLYEKNDLSSLLEKIVRLINDIELQEKKQLH